MLIFIQHFGCDYFYGSDNTEIIESHSTFKRPIKDNYKAKDVIVNKVNSKKLKPVDLFISKDSSRNIKQSCISESQFINDSRQSILKGWVINTFGFGKVDYVNYLNEEELINLSNTNNDRAMLILGLNYRWNARFNNSQSPFVKPPEIPEINYKAKQYDQTMMKKAIAWLKKAAYHGNLGAFTELSIAYDYEIEFLRNHSDSSKIEHKTSIEELILTSLAYQNLINYIFPNLEPEKITQTGKRLTADRRMKYHKLLNKLKQQWQKERLKLGYNENIDLDVPKEFYELKVLEQKLCD